MLDSQMQQAYLSSFQYDDIDNTALPGEVDCTPRVGDEGVLYVDYPDGSGDTDELMFRVGVMDSGLPVIETRASADAGWDDEPLLFFDEAELRSGISLVLQSRAHADGSIPNLTLHVDQEAREFTLADAAAGQPVTEKAYR